MSVCCFWDNFPKLGISTISKKLKITKYEMATKPRHKMNDKLWEEKNRLIGWGEWQSSKAFMDKNGCSMIPLGWWVFTFLSRKNRIYRYHMCPIWMRWKEKWWRGWMCEEEWMRPPSDSWMMDELIWLRCYAAKKKWWIGWIFEGKRMRWPRNGWMRNGGVGSRFPRSHVYAAFCVSGASVMCATDIGFLQGREVESSSQCCRFVSVRKQGFYRYAGC